MAWNVDGIRSSQNGIYTKKTGIGVVDADGRAIHAALQWNGFKNTYVSV